MKYVRFKEELISGYHTIDEGVITKEDSMAFMKLLSSDNYDVRRNAWDKVEMRIDEGVITKDNSMAFIELLSLDDGDVRSEAWDEVEKFIDKGILTKEDVKGKFIELLSDVSKNARNRAIMVMLRDKEIITKRIIRLVLLRQLT